MSIAALIRSMADAGAPAEAIALAVEAVEAASAGVEARRASDRVRKQRQRDKAADVTGQSRDASADVTAATLSPSLPPQTPPTRPHTRECVSTHARDAREDASFAKFWEAYPRKVSKADARKAFTKAYRKLPPFDEDAILIGGLERAKAGWTDAQFIPHPASWLNGERWTDEPPPPETPRQAHERSNPDAKFTRRQETLGAYERGADSAARRWHAEHG